MVQLGNIFFCFGAIWKLNEYGTIIFIFIRILKPHLALYQSLYDFFA